MTDLHDDRKKEEEEFGGFEPGKDEDDESFLLGEDGEYPAKLPDNFSDEEPIGASDLKNIEVTDLANDEAEEDVESEEPELPVEEEVEEVTAEEIQEEPEIVDSEEPSENLEEVGDEEEDEIEEELDDDFKKQLQQSIDASKARREANAADDDGIEPSGELAMPIGDDADTIVNLSDIDADKPSNYDPEANENLQEEVPATKKEQEVVEPKETEEKKKKKTPVWLLMLYSSAATFLLTLGVGFLFWWLMTDSSEHTEGEDTQKTEQVAQNDDNHNGEQHGAGDEAELNETALGDSLGEEEDNWLDSMDANMDIAAKDTMLQFKEDKEMFAELEDEIDNNVKKEEPKKKTEPKSNNKKKITSDKKKKDLATNNTNVKKNKPKTRTKTKVDESQFSMPQPKGPAPETGIFTVQIYSSPSKIDAESWLGQLKAKELPYAMLVEKEIRGKTWYRVRYGKFETKGAARASALELGYSQSWIDRVE